MRNMEIGKYEEIMRSLPAGGQQIIAQHTEHDIIVYQAYNTAIAEYAVRKQKVRRKCIQL
jgi:hypothetical protein